MRSRILTLGIVGSISSIITIVSFPVHFTNVAPGTIYGLMLSIGFFFLSRNLVLWRVVVFTIASTMSYIAAWYATISVYTVLSDFHLVALQISAFMFGGFVGSVFLLLAFHYLIFPLGLQSYWMLVLLGTALGASFFIANLTFVSLYLCWQTGVSIGLGIATKTIAIAPEVKALPQNESVTKFQQKV